MRTYRSLRRRADFTRVTRRGRRHGAAHLTCLVADGRLQTRIGLQVGTAVGSAVVRNLVRRRIRAILDRYGFAERPPLDLVFIARAGAGELSFAQLRAEVERSFGLPP